MKDWRKNRKRLKIIRLYLKLKKLLDNLGLTELHELYETISSERFRKKIERRIIKMATGDDDLLDIVKNETNPLRTKAWKKLKSRIKNDCIKKTSARPILIKIMSVPELRKEVWKLLKTLDPTNEELKKLQESDFISSMPNLAYEIEKLLRKKLKNKKGAVDKIQVIIGELEKLKKGQS